MVDKVNHQLAESISIEVQAAFEWHNVCFHLEVSVVSYEINMLMQEYAPISELSSCLSHCRLHKILSKLVVVGL
jgi:hypothetical protein